MGTAASSTQRTSRCHSLATPAPVDAETGSSTSAVETTPPRAAEEDDGALNNVVDKVEDEGVSEASVVEIEENEAEVKGWRARRGYKEDFNRRGEKGDTEDKTAHNHCASTVCYGT